MKNKEIDCCTEKKVHEEIVDKTKKEMPNDEVLADLSDLFRVFGDTTRVKIIFALFSNEMCVCDIAEDIAELLGMTQSAISHQLRVLKNARLVKFRKEGKTVFYSLDDEHISEILKCGLEHVNETYKR